MRNFHFLHLTKKFLPCEQWFLEVGRYGAKGKKTLRATLRFSIKDARPRDAYVKTSNGVTSSHFAGKIWDLHIQRQDRIDNVSKTIGLSDRQNNNFARASRFSVRDFFAVFARLRRENA